MAATKKIRVDRTYSTDNDTEDKGVASLVEKARQLNTSRTINGVGFNGTANISFGTDSVSEGSNNLYFSNARARGALSGSTGISYNSSTGAISCTITQYTDTNARAALSGGTGISYNSGTGAIALSGSYTGTWAVTGAITATGEVTAYFSDLRLKTNIVPIADALDKVEAINGVTFDPNEAALALGIDARHQMGVIAQEVEAVAPELVCDSAFAGYKTVRYDKLTALLIEAVKELSAKVTTLEAQLGNTKPTL